jgi:hypothetical protein
MGAVDLPVAEPGAWDCVVTIDGHRCPEPAVAGGLCVVHERRAARQWRLIATNPDGATIHDSRVHGDAGLNDAIHALESRPDWTKRHRVRVAPA